MPNYMTELSPDNNANVYQVKDKEAAPITLLKDTVGWVGKNLLNIKDGTATQPTQVYYENDTIIVAGGTWANFNTPTIKFSKSKSLVFSLDITVTSGTLNYAIVKNGSNVAEDNFTESTSKIVSLQVSANDEILVRFRSPNNGVGVFSNIMLRDASILDDTYEPYHKSVEEVVEQVYADNGVLGAKNLLKINNTGVTSKGVTYTVNSDGSVNSSGTSNASWANCDLTQGYQKIPKGKYILSGISGGSQNTYRMVVEREGVTTNINLFNGELELDFDTTYNVKFIIAVSAANVDMSNKIFYPMLRLASDPDDTYVPYAMTNRELTEIVEDEVTNIVSGASVYTNTVGNHLLRQANVVSMHVGLNAVTANAGTTLCVIPTRFRPKYDVRFFTKDNTFTVFASDGTVKCSENLSNALIFLCTCWITS